ncbi:contact-dependent growth inhibition system immunity protein [Streptomyces bauhiniae]|uniref:contact-dependent growth inhibition system immunity protein n=1 Tax=Streptomyces bauhiniae TaxID=2340725 RepID=UPI003643DD59
MNRQISRDRSLEELEHDRWPAPSGEATRLVATVHALRRKPLVALTVEDLRVLIRQDVCLGHVLPLALEVLRKHPMAEGDLYEGDLLSAVLTRRPEVWRASPELVRDLCLIVSELADPPSPVRQEASRFLALHVPDGSDFGA